VCGVGAPVPGGAAGAGAVAAGGAEEPVAPIPPIAPGLIDPIPVGAGVAAMTAGLLAVLRPRRQRG